LRRKLFGGKKIERVQAYTDDGFIYAQINLLQVSRINDNGLTKMGRNMPPVRGSVQEIYSRPFQKLTSILLFQQALH
jgi:hypothetical protein